MAVARGMDELERLDEALQKLRVAYEKYFAGIERIEPLKDREAFKKALRRLTNEPTHNTARRFRMQGIQASLITYENYWTRVCRQIEEGTFRRDRWRASRMAASPEAAAETASAAVTSPAVDTVGETIGETAPSRGDAAPAATPPGYPASLHKLHDALVTARAKVGDTRPVSLDALATTVRKQVSDIKSRYQCDSVEFKVAVKDGKVVLKAVPKRAEVNVGAPGPTGASSKTP